MKLHILAMIGITLFPFLDADATTLLSHIGSNNPTSEGWTVQTNGSNPPSTSFAAINDNGTPAWSLSNPSGAQSNRYYVGAIAPSAMANAKLTGYEITFRVRGLPNNNAESQEVALSDGTKFWSISFRGNPSGTGTRLGGNYSGNLISIDDYATVTLRLDPGDAVMDILVNGIDRLQYLSSSPFGTANPRLEWGWAAPPNSSGNEGRYALVQMNTIPEPSTYALLALGGAIIISATRRRRANS